MKNKLALVISDYYKEITDSLVTGFNTQINKDFQVDIFYVTGAWEIIYKINSLTDNYDKFVAIGAIIKGETDHYEYISNGVANGLINLTINKNIYISNCILNVHNIEDAINRAENNDKNKGLDSARAINKLFS